MSFINWGHESPEQLKARKEMEDALLFEQAMYSAAVASAASAGSGGNLSDSYTPPDPEPGETLYYIRIFDASNSNALMFTGFFYVNDSTHIVQRFYNLIDPTFNIRSTGGTGGPTYLYYPGWLCFDGGGCNVIKFPYLYGETLGDYNLYGNTSTSTGNSVDGEGPVTFEFSLTPF